MFPEQIVELSRLVKLSIVEKSSTDFTVMMKHQGIHTWRKNSGYCYGGLKVHSPELFVFAGVLSLSAADPLCPGQSIMSPDLMKIGSPVIPRKCLIISEGNQAVNLV